MRKITFLAVEIVLINIFFLSNCYAGDADTYKITVQSIQLKTEAGNWVTIASPNQEIDIASVAAGATAASLLSDSVIPAGNYVNFKLVLSETMKVSGSDGANYTKSGGVLTISGSDANAASTATWVGTLPNATLSETAETHTTTASEQGEITSTLNLNANDGNNYIEVYCKTGLTTPMVVTANSTISMWFDFDTAGTVHYANPGGDDMMYYTPPGEGTAFSITVDDRTATITEANMRIDF